LLVDFFTKEHGIVACVAKGQRSKKNASQLSQFCIYQVAFSGKSDLKSLVKLESAGQRYLLHKQALFSGFYINEILLRVLYPYDSHPELFERCRQVFEQLASLGDSTESFGELEIILRSFEFSLLDDIGYLIDMRYDWKTGEPIDESKKYMLDIDNGLTQFINSPENQQQYFSGKTICLIADMNFAELSKSAKKNKFEAKVLSRLLLAPHLGNKPLQSKALFQKLK
jgi:DNA repair protein RecO (recombination protein O)